MGIRVGVRFFHLNRAIRVRVRVRFTVRGSLNRATKQGH